MIRIENKVDCCGCSACSQGCPRNCITMKEDSEGFLYPVVDESLCVDCGLCEKICPINNPKAEQKPVKVLAAINNDEKTREESSSGGVFTALAENVIRKGGVVFGVKFDYNWNVVHGYTETMEGLASFRGSKYVQSEIGNSYQQAKQFLNEGRMVLFSGTPCQIAGLYGYLRKDHQNLITVDVVCHGVPSPRVWKEYVNSLRRPKGAVAGKNTVLSSLNDTPSIEGISFRDKRNGWKKYSFVVRYSVDRRETEKFGLSPVNARYKEILWGMRQNPYMNGFLNDFYLRESCYDCSFRSGKSHSDITLADFWGIQHLKPEIDDDKGVSLVLLNTGQGQLLFDDILDNIKSYPSSYQDALHFNQPLEQSSPRPDVRDDFWREYERIGIDAVNKTIKKLQPSFWEVQKMRFNHVLRILKLK